MMLIMGTGFCLPSFFDLFYFFVFFLFGLTTQYCNVDFWEINIDQNPFQFEAQCKMSGC